MNKVHKILYFLICLLATTLGVCSLLSILRNTENRYLKMLDFPRIQFFLVALIFLVAVAIFLRVRKWHHFLLIGSLTCGLLINGFFIVNYTFLVPVSVPWAQDSTITDTGLRLILANVKMSNRNSDPLTNLIKIKKPDIILIMEVDGWWNENLKKLEKNYPYFKKAINDVAYGMVLYSKFPLKQVDVNYLQNKKVPSFETTIELGNGMNISFKSVHPVPPTRFKELPDNAHQQEVALKVIGKEIMDEKLPTIVAGDLNDVVWSHVDALTGTRDILYDVRKGRGFYNSYNAENIFMRWPLDHIFVTREFRVRHLERLSKIGSDHFPIFVELKVSTDVAVPKS